MTNPDKAEGPKYHGHMTKVDGSHVPLTSEQAEAIWKSADEEKNKRAVDMPTDEDALRVMVNAWQRLRELGWSEACYCPKDGSSLDCIEAGNTGIHRAHYSGEWPSGSVWIEDAGDLWPSKPILFRLDPDAAEVKRKRMADAAEKFARERLAEDFAAKLNAEAKETT